MKDIHDRGYQKLLSNLEIFRQLVVTFVRKPWVKDLDFSKCELLKESFVSKRYKRTFSDLIYKIKVRGRNLYIVVLLEFKATSERFVALQMLGYIVDFYRHLRDSRARLKKLPPVFPILLYNGKKRWTAPQNLSTLIDGDDLLGKQALRFSYWPIIENAFSKKELLQIGNIVSTLFLADVHYDFDLLCRELVKLHARSRNKQAVSLLMNWFEQLWRHGRIEEAEYKTFERIYYGRKEVNMMIEAIKKEKRQLRQQGVKQGVKQGMTKVAKSMLVSGEPVEKIRRYTGLSTETIRELTAPKRRA